MAKRNESYEERLKQAALEGVTMRLKNGQPFYVVRFLKKCSVNEVVCKSKEVKDLAINNLTKGFDREYSAVCFGARENLKTVFDLLKAVKVSDDEITKIIMDYFEGYRQSHYGQLPRDFGHILQAYPIPVEVLNKNKKLEEAAQKEVFENRVSDDHFSRRRSFLKYFSFPRKELESLVSVAMSNFAFNGEDEAELDKFVEEAKFNRGEILEILTKLISQLISEGLMKEVEVLVGKYSVDTRLFLNEQNKMAAIEGVLRSFSYGDSEEIGIGKQMIETFGLVRADFDDDRLEKAIGERLGRSGYEKMMELLDFADWPREKTVKFIRGKLVDLLRLDMEKLKTFSDQYDISWEEIVGVAQNEFIRGLARSGGGYLKGFIEKFGFSQEFLSSIEVVSAAKEGLLVLYRYADHDNNIGFLTETFGIS